MVGLNSSSCAGNFYCCLVLAPKPIYSFEMWNNKHQLQQIPKGILYQSQPCIETRYKTIDSKSQVAALQNLKITTSRNLFVASSEDNNLNSRNLPFKKDFGKWTYIFTPNKAAFSNLLFRLIAFYSCNDYLSFTSRPGRNSNLRPCLRKSFFNHLLRKEKLNYF